MVNEKKSSFQLLSPWDITCHVPSKEGEQYAQPAARRFNNNSFCSSLIKEFEAGEEQINPITVYEKENADIIPLAGDSNNGIHPRYVLITGYHRLIAARDAKLATIKALVYHYQPTSDEIFMMRFKENHFRAAASPVDTAHNIRKLETLGKSRKEIAKLFGKTEAWICTQLRLLDLTEMEQLMIHQGKIKASSALRLLNLSAEARAEALTRLQNGVKLKGSDLLDLADSDDEEEGKTIKLRSPGEIIKFFMQLKHNAYLKKQVRVTAVADTILTYLRGGVDADQTMLHLEYDFILSMGQGEEDAECGLGNPGGGLDD